MMPPPRSTAALFHDSISEICAAHRPSHHPFFRRLAGLPPERLTPALLAQLYRRYQAAMHSTRAAVYWIPGLDEISLRTQKLKIIADDDGLPNGETHHAQLRRTFETLLEGRADLAGDEIFGDLEELQAILDPATAQFVRQVRELYPKTLGPWVVTESLAHDFIGALLSGLQPHFPEIGRAVYFEENFNNHIEVEHARESQDLAAAVLTRRPALLPATVAGAEAMAAAFDALWSGMEGLLRETRAPALEVPVPSSPGRRSAPLRRTSPA